MGGGGGGGGNQFFFFKYSIFLLFFFLFSLSLSLWYLCIKLNGRRHQHIIMFSLICFDLFIVFDNRDNIEGTSVSKICLIFVYVLFDICVWIRFSRHHLTRVYKCAFVYD